MGFRDVLDDMWDDKRQDVNKYLFAMLIAVLKEVGQIAAKELAKGLEEYLKEAKTPDGWTREEYLSYAVGRLRMMEAEKIGPSFVDRLLDMAIERLIDHLNGKLEDLASDPEPEPEPEPTPEPEPPEPVYGPYDVLFGRTPDPANYENGDTLWEKTTTDPSGVVAKMYRVLKGAVGYPGEKMVGFRDENGTWTLY